VTVTTDVPLFLSEAVAELAVQVRHPKGGDHAADADVLQLQNLSKFLLHYAGDRAPVISELLTIAEVIALNLHVGRNSSTADSLVDAVELLGDAAQTEGREVHFEAPHGMALDVMSPSSSELSMGFHLGSFQVPPVNERYLGVCAIALKWVANPYGELAESSGLMWSFSFRANGSTLRLTGLSPPLLMNLDQTEVTEVKGDVAKHRSVVFWNVTSRVWSDVQLTTIWANFTHVRAESTHATCFAVRLVGATCPFCRSPLPNGFWEFDIDLDLHDNADMWICASILMILHLSFVPLRLQDRADWVPLWENKAVYFTPPVAKRGKGLHPHWPFNRFREKKVRRPKCTQLNLMVMDDFEETANPKSGAVGGVINILDCVSGVGLDVCECATTATDPLPETWAEDDCRTASVTCGNSQVSDGGCDLLSRGADSECSNPPAETEVVPDSSQGGTDFCGNKDDHCPYRIPSPAVKHKGFIKTILAKRGTEDLKTAGVCESLCSLVAFLWPRLGHSLHMTRCQRYAMVLNAIMSSAFFQILLFMTGGGCHHEPQPAVCQSALSPFGWERLVQSAWGIAFTVPTTIVLHKLFYKMQVRMPMTRDEKDARIRMMLRRERCGWFVIFVVHSFFTFTTFRFMQTYPLIVIRKWFLGCVISSFTAFVSSPSFRGMMYLQAHLIKIALKE